MKCANEKQQINMMEEREGYDEDDIFYTDTVTVENEATSTLEVSVNTINADKWIVPLTGNGTEIHMKLDTGAMANLITLKDFKALHHKPVIKNTQKWD